MELLQIVRRPVKKRRAGLGEFRQEQRIRLVPSETHRGLVEHLEGRSLAVDHQERRQAGGRQDLVADDVFEVIADVLRAEGMAVRPFVAFAGVQREDPAVLDLDVFQNVGNEFQRLVVTDQAGVAPDVDQAHVLGPADQRVERPAVFAGGTALGLQVDDQRLGRQPFGDRRQRRVEARRLLQFERGERPRHHGRGEEHPGAYGS
jgi:hypothetical protein